MSGETAEIILSDFGSEPDWAEELKRLADRHGARIVRTETDEIWNRSRALNVGIRAARGHYVLCTDADMIFAPDFLEALLVAQDERGDQALAVCRCRDLPESVPEQPWTVEDVPSLVEQSTFRERLGTGACQMATRSFFEDVRGFDEGFKFWGLEDTDMTYRAQRWGLSLSWVHDHTAMMHQWHPSDRQRRPFRKTLNDIRFHLTKWRIRKNPGSWGLAP